MSVHVEHIDKHFGNQHVLRDVSLSIPEGQVLGLLGPNGAGKSTLMKILVGLVEPDNGSIQVPEHIGYLPENNPLYEEMYVSEYLQFMYSLEAKDERQKARVDELIERVVLPSPGGPKSSTWSRLS